MLGPSEDQGTGCCLQYHYGSWLDTIRNGYDFDVIGMAKGASNIREVTHNNKVGFFATDFTVSTGAHKREIERLDPGVEVFGLGCPKLVPLIESENLVVRKCRKPSRNMWMP